MILELVRKGMEDKSRFSLACRSRCLAAAYLGHVKWWWMVLRMPFLQWGHSADSTRFIWWRIVFRGMCPVLSWVRRLAWLHRSWSMMWRKLSEGRVASMLFTSAYHFEVFHSICHRAFIFFFRSCFVAEMLTRRGFCLRKGGRSFILLDCPEAVSLAASSAFLLPSIPLCPGV